LTRHRGFSFSFYGFPSMFLTQVFVTQQMSSIKSPKFPNYHPSLSPFLCQYCSLARPSNIPQSLLTTNMHPGTKCCRSTCPQAPFATIAASHINATKQQKSQRQIQYYIYGMRCISTTWPLLYSAPPAQMHHSLLEP
jgi:hypothetical protein